MFKVFYILLFLGFMLVTGCAETETQQDDTNADKEIRNGNVMDDFNAEPLDGQVGYVRFSKDQLDETAEQNRTVKVNREKMADMITRMILRYDGFEDVATLVTDYEVLVAYKAPANHNRNEAADMVQKTAYSLVPSFYRVYVSDDSTAFGDIQSVSTSTVYDDQYREVIDSIINKMKLAPQGKVRQNDDQMGDHNKGQGS